MTARYIVGDVFAGLASLEDDSVDLIMSSPPFLALRSYLPADHPDKGKEIGSEATPADFLDTLLDVVEACDRVLAPHGSLCFELGDTYANKRGYGSPDPEYGERSRIRWEEARAEKWWPGKDGDAWPDEKSLCGIPTLFAWSLAYGRNLLRPERETPRWRIRNLVVWARPNPPVGALGDKFRPATSYLTVATKSRSRYFDLDAVRGPYSENTNARTAKGVTSRPNTDKTADDEGRGGNFSTLNVVNNDGAGAPPLDYWVIPTAPYAGSHYATFPPDLVVKPVKAMCPQKVCRVCGEPSRRIVETAYIGAKSGKPYEPQVWASGIDGGQAAHTNKPPDEGARVVTETLGWTDCEHDDWRTGTVLDPFAGSGTTLSVATGHGRDAIGIDLDARNADLALDRVGPLLLTVEVLNAEPAA